MRQRTVVVPRCVGRGVLLVLGLLAFAAACAGADPGQDEPERLGGAVPVPLDDQGEELVLAEAAEDAADLTTATTATTAIKPKDLGGFGGNFNQPADVNGRGTVVGLSTLKDDSVVPFIYEGGKLRELTEITRLGEPKAINESGKIVGVVFEFNPDVAQARAVLLDGKKLIKLESKHAVANDINEKGQIVGEDSFQAVTWEGTRQKRLPNPAGAIQSLASAINNLGHIVGTANFKGTDGAVLWIDGKPKTLGKFVGPSTRGLSINDKDQVVGVGETADGGLRGFLWQNGVFTDLGQFLPDDIDNNGRIVGVNQAGQAFVWRAGKLTPLANLRKSGGSSIANAISDQGHIVGESFLRNGVSRSVLWKL